MTLLEQFDALYDLSRNPLMNGTAFSRAFVPAADLVVTPDEVVVVMDVPGLKPENLDIELIDDVLKVKGERSYPFATAGGRGAGASRHWFRLERGYGRFERTLQVPKGLDPEHITASMADGVLSLHIPQPKARKPRRIEVAAGGMAAPDLDDAGEATDLDTARAEDERELAGATA